MKRLYLPANKIPRQFCKPPELRTCKENRSRFRCFATLDDFGDVLRWHYWSEFKTAQMVPVYEVKEAVIFDEPCLM